VLLAIKLTRLINYNISKVNHQFWKEFRLLGVKLRPSPDGPSTLGSKNMSQNEYEAAVAAFIQTNGVTRCPTACVVRTQGTVSPADQEALRQRAVEVELRRNRRRFITPMFFGKNAAVPH
jgi:hypothetical protein